MRREEARRNRSIKLREERDAGGSRFLSASLRADGTIQIQGHDLGPAVGALGAGLSEYEWYWTVPAAALTDLVASLGGQPGDDPLTTIGRWFEQHRTDPGIALKEAKVPIEFWSQIGE